MTMYLLTGLMIAISTLTIGGGHKRTKGTGGFLAIILTVLLWPAVVTEMFTNNKKKRA